jgi:hypothetical protein
MGRRVSSHWVTGLNDYNLSKVRFRADEVQQIHQAYKTVKSQMRLAEEFRCSSFTINRVLHYQGIYRKYRDAVDA